MNWDLLMSDSDIVTSLKTFYSIVNKVIDENIPNQKSSPSTYPEWNTSKLNKLISDKKEMHAKWKEQMELRAHNNGQMFSYITLNYFTGWNFKVHALNELSYHVSCTSGILRMWRTGYDVT